MRFSDAFLEELRSRINLEELVSEYVPLKQKGRRFWGCCPFHHEKTPSFSVDTQNQMYYCFGCHKGGTAIQFVREMERMEFYEAVKYLAERAHMDLPEEREQDRKPSLNSQERERMYEANVQAARYFHSLLWKNEGGAMLNYLYKRGLTDVDIRRFGLGASADSWDGLLSHLGTLGFEPALLKKAGLAVEKDGKYFDMFRNRVMFPIINAQGKVLGFGGRTMGDAKPKYMNTVETPIFNKGHGLYAMNFVRNERDVDHLVLTEGYMDTISMRKNGVRGVIATLGTALTEDQAKMIKRFVPEVWISYDGDAAGQKAALRALDIFETIDGITAKVIDYPTGQDPDDFMRMYGREGFEKLKRYGPAEYRMLRAEDGLDLSTQEGLTQYAMKCCEALRKVKSPIELDNHVRVLSRKTGYEKEVLMRQIGVVQPGKEAWHTSVPAERKKTYPGQKKKVVDFELAENVLLTMLSQGLIPAEMVDSADFSNEVRKHAAEWLLSGKSAASFVETLEDAEEISVAMQALNYSPLPTEHDDLMQMAQSSRKTIRNDRLHRRLESLEEEIKTADSARRTELYRKIMAITQELEEN